MDWDKLRVFHAAVEAGSFSTAGVALHRSQSAVSRQITALEATLQTVLFHRHARGLRLTEQGETLHRAVKEVVAQVSVAEAMLAEHRDYPRGPLKISTTAAFGAFWLAPRLREFNDLYPEIALTLMLDGGGADLAMREADIAIRMSPPEQPDWVQRRLFAVRSFAFAAPDYLKAFGTPCGGQDLDHHRLLVELGDERLGVGSGEWLLELGAGAEKRRATAQFDNIYPLYRALLGGLGIGALPHFLRPERAGLIRVLPQLAAPIREAYFAYPAELRRSKRIAVFRDFVVRRLAEAEMQAEPNLRAGGPAAGDDIDRLPAGPFSCSLQLRATHLELACS